MIQQTTIDFLKKLKKNNNRDWFEKNKALYKAAQSDMETLTNTLISAIRGFDKRVESTLDAKKCMFRIYRDTRFSKDKTPYKINMGASINPGGRMSPVPGYYLHIEPGGCFLAGGIYMPQGPEIAKIRQEIDYNLPEFKKILGHKDFKKYFGELDPFDKLKTVPKGYPKDHPALSYLQYRSFIMVHNFKEDAATSKNFVKQATAVYKAMLPLNRFLQRAID
ncbi:MAG: hypothetical protein FD123_1576 [Bacteroidetes bacterium]|nr:MAG: hypothetical protein FD123_1576 [Bacteroidota bacterium]